MSEHIGKFVWYDLMTSDSKAAESFYRSVIGWDAKDSGLTDRSYTIFSMGPTWVAGLMPIPESARAMGAGPLWMGYIGVDDVDAYAARVKAAGGAIRRAPEDIPGVGRFSVVADPHGATFALFRGLGDPQTPADAGNIPGCIRWHELHAQDGAAAFAFYSELFGWTKGEAMNMGPMGIYQMFAAGGAPIGGMMTKTPEIPMPLWLYYFNVTDIDAAVERVEEGGGQVAHGPIQVPGGSWILQCIDPQGGMFALIGQRIDEPAA
jgi:uncharacterized protein